MFWLHTQLHLPFRGCNAVLVIVAYLLESAGVRADPPIATTLPTIMSHLGVDPAFQTLPVCPKCFEIFLSTIATSTICPTCQHPIFQQSPSRARNPPPPKPYLRFPTKSLEVVQLKEMLAVPGVEDAMDSWRIKTRVLGTYNDFFDGRVSREIIGHDNLPFFRNAAPEGQLPAAPDNELRIGVTLGVDW